MHTHYYLALLGIILTAPLAAQWGPGGQAGQPAGHAYGRLLDEQRKPVPFASISIFKGDSLVGGALVEENGDFSIDRLPLGELKLKVAAMGYKPFERPFTLTPERLERDLGNLRVTTDEVVLEAAEVSRERATQVLQVDRRVYNVQKDISVEGGDATDVMKNIPGLSVTEDGAVELRGKSPRVYVDGRPTPMSLDQIPASDIERVEVITNPSAAFDADATGGIVNVVMKRSTRPGFNGQVQAGIGTNDRYNGNVSLMARQGRSAFNTGMGFRLGRPLGESYSDRTDLEGGIPTTYFRQDADRVNKYRRYNARLGWDYDLNVRNTLSLMQTVGFGNRGSREEQVFTTRNAAHELLGEGTQLNHSDGKFNNYTTRAGFKRKTRKEGKEWGTDLTFSLSERNSPATTDEHNNWMNGGQGLAHDFQSRDSRSRTQRWTWQLDVSDAYADYRKLEWGFKADLDRQRSSLDVSFLNDTVPDLTRDPDLSNAYLILTMVNAGYVNWSTRLNSHWSMQAGLRVEQNSMVADRTDKDQSFRYDYPGRALGDLGRILFPSVYLSRKWDAEVGELQRELQVNLSRKVDRPRHWQMMPYLWPVDSRSYRTGNPELKPEMSTIIEVNHMLPFGGKGNWLTSVYGRFTQDVITSYNMPMPDNPDILLSSYQNGDRDEGFGWENTVKLTIWNGLEATLNANVQWVRIGMQREGRSYRNTGVNTYAKGNLSQKLPKEFTLQLNGDYIGPRITPQGHSMERYSMDISVRKGFGPHWSATASLENIFDSRGWGSYYDMPTFTQESFRTWGNRALRVSVTWRFGKADQPLFRRRGTTLQERRVPGSGAGEEGGMD